MKRTTFGELPHNAFFVSEDQVWFKNGNDYACSAGYNCCGFSDDRVVISLNRKDSEEIAMTVKEEYDE